VIESYGLGGSIHQLGATSFEGSIAAQRDSHLLLLLAWEDPSQKGTCPAKVFEYMAVGRPVLSLGAVDSTGSKVVEETGLGRAFAAPDAAGVRAYLTELLRAFRSEGDIRPDLKPHEVERYSQVEMARSMASVLEDAVG
jgi:hypothetical protein